MWLRAHRINRVKNQVLEACNFRPGKKAGLGPVLQEFYPLLLPLPQVLFYV